MSPAAIAGGPPSSTRRGRRRATGPTTSTRKPEALAQLRQQRRIATALVAEAHAVTHDQLARRRGADDEALDELFRGERRERRGEVLHAPATSIPVAAIKPIRSRSDVISAGGRSGRNTATGCGLNVIATASPPIRTRLRDDAGENRLMPTMDAVEIAQRQDRRDEAPRARGDVTKDFHSERLELLPGLSRLGRGRVIVQHLLKGEFGLALVAHL